MSSAPYEIFVVDPQATREHEQMGSKAKFWFRASGRNWLFKRCRPNTGEDWAEKIAAEIATQLGLPHATVELAESGGERGSISLDFADGCALIHGNELLLNLDPNYPVREFWQVSAHTIDNVLQVVSNSTVELPPGSQNVGLTAAQMFVGYLALDALIGNVDRHHENWGLLQSEHGASLAPTYDHASSLGRELLDARRKTLLDAGGVAAYAHRARSALYADASDGHPLSPRAAFWAASERVPNTREIWIARIEELSEDVLGQIIHRVPSERISAEASEFATQLVLKNKRALRAGPPDP